MGKALKKIITIIAFIIIFVLYLVNTVYYSNMTHWEIPQIQYYGVQRLTISIVIGLIILVLSYFLNKIKIKKKLKIIIISFLLAIYSVVQITWITKTPAVQFADSLVVMQIAEKMEDNQELNEYQKNYLQYYPQQLTMAVIFMKIFKICANTNELIFKILNILSNILTVLGLYFILFEIQKNYKVNRILFWILSLSFIPVILLSCFIYGDFIGLACVVWSLWFAQKYLKCERKKYIFFIGILMCLACLVRMNYFIFEIAIIITIIIGKLEKKELNFLVVFKTVIVCSYIIVATLIPNILIKEIYSSKYDLKKDNAFSTIPYLYMGMSEGERANGWYNDETDKIVENLMFEKENRELITAECKQKLKNRISFLINHPMYTVRFYRDKIITIWSDPTMEFKFYNTYNCEELHNEVNPIVKKILYEKWYDYIVVYVKSLILIILGGAMLLLILKHKNLSLTCIPLYLVFIGGFLFHIIWEAKSRYIIPYVLVLIPVACAGFEEFIEKIKNKKEKM